ncbi:hypothetical protein TCAL_17203 [Tigriopus californicus]|uniref:Uncharacterized protein n=1 Tax=Tigriopus californicus TaxID=6832 RepID=A0A553N8S2_TIGCA|nr:hypothetical protein TCAL_17203 [Tigriopus californicus]
MTNLKKASQTKCTVVVLGDSKTGKTSLITRFVKGTFTEMFDHVWPLKTAEKLSFERAEMFNKIKSQATKIEIDDEQMREKESSSEQVLV